MKMQGQHVTEPALRCAVRWMIGLCLLLVAVLSNAWASAGSAGAGTAIDISRGQRLDLSGHVQVCVSRPEASIEEVLRGACEWDNRSPPSVSRGFDSRAFWMRLELINRSTTRIDRLLSVGHPRLQEVSLFQVRETGLPVALGLGGNQVALSAKPVPLPRPSFRLEFDAWEQKTLWMRVASETILEFAPEIQSLETGYFHAQRLQLFQALALGCMLLCFLYSLGTYLILRERTLMFFAIFMAAEIQLELTRSGLLQTFLWPANLPFDPRMLPLGAAISTGAFSLFLREFMPDLSSHRVAHALFRLAISLFYAGILWSLLIDYRAGSNLWSYALIVWMLSVLALAILSWRKGSRTAKLLFQSFMLLMGIELLRFWSVAGLLDFSDIEQLGNPVAIAMTSAFILIGMIRRLREMQTDLDRTRAESAARLSFMSQMSHELRSPLTTILGQLKLLTRTEIPARASRMVESMRQDAGQLLAMIDDILDYAQGTAGKQGLRCGACRWDQLVERIRQRARILTQVNSNQLMFRCEGPAHALLRVDEHRLLQVLSNLLANAANYCRHGVIELTCRIEPATEIDHWHLGFSVSDNGPGIPREDQQRVFQPFERGAQSHLSHHKGIGMGLAISRQLVELMGGDLVLSSESGQGCHFCFRISCQAAQPEELEWDEDEHQTAPLLSESVLHQHQTVPAVSDAQPFLLPGKDQLTQLLRLVDNGQITDILELVDHIEKMKPELAPFCCTVRDLSLQLDLAALRSLCSGYFQD